MERRIDYSIMKQQQDARAEMQASRAANSGVDGVSKFYAKAEPLRVRFLTPYSFGIDFQLHSVKSPSGTGTDHFVCEKQFSADPMQFCPICDDAQKFADAGHEKLSGEIKKKNKKVFLVYVYDWAGKTYQTQGVTKASNVLGVFEVGPGDRNGKNFLAIGSTGEEYGGLTNVDVIIQKFGTGLDSYITFKPAPQQVQLPNGQIANSGGPFNTSLIPPDVFNLLPQLPGEVKEIDPNNPQLLQLINQWGDFYFKASRYRTVDEYQTPQATYSAAPHQGVHQTYQMNPGAGAGYPAMAIPGAPVAAPMVAPGIPYQQPMVQQPYTQAPMAPTVQQPVYAQPPMMVAPGSPVYQQPVAQPQPVVAQQLPPQGFAPTATQLDAQQAVVAPQEQAPVQSGFAPDPVAPQPVQQAQMPEAQQPSVAAPAPAAAWD